MNEQIVEQALGKLKSPKGFLYAGLPKFEALFGRDSVISALQLLDYDVGIAVKTLAALAAYQGKETDLMSGEEPGKILHELQESRKLLGKRNLDVPWLKEGPNYFSVDSTPLFIILAHDLLTRGVAEAEEGNLRKQVLMALSWIIDYGIRNTFLSYMKASRGSGLQSQSWKDGIGIVLEQMKDPVSIVGVQGYAYEAMVRGMELIDHWGLKGDKSELYESLKIRLSGLREHFDDNFFLEETGYYAMAIDGDGVAEKTISSDPGHVIASGLLSRERERQVVDRLFEDDLMTDYGIRCLSTSSQYFDERAYQRGSVWPHDNFMICRGLDVRGYHKESSEIKKRIVDALDQMGSFPEYYGVDRGGDLIPNSKMRIETCDPQAWTLGAYHYSKRTMHK